MAHNNTVTLTGNIGTEPRLIEGEENSFIAFSLATADSYQDEREQWVQKETIWHSVLAFSPKVVTELKALKSGTRIRITGSLSYKSFSTQLDDGRIVDKKEASIIAKKLELATLTPKRAA